MLISTDIHKILNELGYVMQEGKIQPSYAWEHFLGNDIFVYIKFQKDKPAVKKAPLVIPPSSLKFREIIDAIDGVLCKWKPTKSTSYRNYPKSETGTQYGFDLDIESKEALCALISLISKQIIIHSTKKSEPSIMKSDIQSYPLNQILYGPPGTGKTYHSITAAVKAAEPNFKPVSENLETQRKEFKAEYDRLTKEKRIRFVTFHQSYGYEEFVEGLRANSDQGVVSYDVESGIFKQICEQASQGVEPVNDPLEQALEQFKADLEESTVLNLKTLRGNDFGVQYHGNTTFRVFPEATSHEDLGRGYPVSIDNIRKLYRGSSVKKIYNSSYVKSILNHIKSQYNVQEFQAPKSGQAKNFVLLIDEINRGNISKIFGELITLIETSKRSGEGQAEALEVVLPNSGDLFSVPDNLYIIGTMNTADRSLAMMDTALRRRFDFKEMMPEPELFKDTPLVRGINLELLLRKMNERIEVLYDREHTLGHAFLIPVSNKADDQDAAFAELKLVFRKKIIPLLEEYFFEDWQKIRLVLGDNQKANASVLQFISETELEYAALFGHSYQPNGYQGESKVYKLAAFNDNNSAWHHPESYIEIYQPSNNS